MLEKNIQLFEPFLTDLDVRTTYVTDSAIGYFIEIRSVLEKIADDLVELETGAKALTPENLDLGMAIYNRIDNLENFLKTANQNNRENADKVLDIRNILIKFDVIQKLMSHPNQEFRKDGMQLFIRTGNLYATTEIQEFINLLDENELKYIMQIVHQEKTLLDKKITNSPIHILASEKLYNKTNIFKPANKDREPCED